MIAWKRHPSKSSKQSRSRPRPPKHRPVDRSGFLHPAKVRTGHEPEQRRVARQRTGASQPHDGLAGKEVRYHQQRYSSPHLVRAPSPGMNAGFNTHTPPGRRAPTASTSTPRPERMKHQGQRPFACAPACRSRRNQRQPRRSAGLSQSCGSPSQRNQKGDPRGAPSRSDRRFYVRR